MTAQEKDPKEHTDRQERSNQALEEICDNTRAIRRVVNRILDQMHEYSEDMSKSYDDHDPDSVSWEDLYDNDDMYE